MPAADPRSPRVVATYSSLGEAQVAWASLNAEGIDASLLGDQLVGIAWHLSNATGGVRVVVPLEQSERARQVLGGVWAGRVVDADGAPLAGEEPDEVGPADRLAEKAWQAALLGFLLFPPALHLWSAWLLVRASRAGGPKTERGRRVAWRALVVDFLVLCVAAAVAARWLQDRVSAG